MIQNDYLVLKWSDIEEHLNDEELENFYDCIAHITNDTPDEEYIVVDSSKPYADKVQELMRKNRPALTKDEAIRMLKELIEVDTEVAHCEADEILIRLINDEDIEKAYDEVDKCY